MRFARTVSVVALLALIAVPAAFALRFTDDSYDIPLAYVGQPYSKQFNGAGGCGPALPYQYTMIGGNLPPGLSLGFYGLISGTPTQVGSYSFWVNLSDQNPPSASWCRPSQSQRQFTITVVSSAPAPAPLKIAQSALNAATATVPYRFQLSASGGGTQTWTIRSGQLPPGITLAPDGVLSGTPTTAGDFSFTVQVSDGVRTDAQTYTLSVVGALKVAPLGAAPVGEVGRPLEVHLAANGGHGPYTWSLAQATSLPAGLTFDTNTATIAGSPTLAGSFTIHVHVTDALGVSDATDVNLVVVPKLTLAQRSVRTKLGRTFTRRLRAAGGLAPRTFKIVAGSLPAGTHFDPRTGTLAGKARRVGTSRLTVQVTDKLGAVARGVLVVTVTR